VFKLNETKLELNKELSITSLQEAVEKAGDPYMADLLKDELEDMKQ
tara:strand:+ start:701 stop:838 length:138 start_codon:yes stop_codon:yes gene_type:complete